MQLKHSKLAMCLNFSCDHFKQLCTATDKIILKQFLPREGK